jgi:hypothetical protein
MGLSALILPTETTASGGAALPSYVAASGPARIVPDQAVVRLVVREQRFPALPRAYVLDDDGPLDRTVAAPEHDWVAPVAA